MDTNQDNFTEYVPETPPDKMPDTSSSVFRGGSSHQQQPFWYHPVEESKYWSPNVVAFFQDGDATFCFSLFLGKEKLGKGFWGILLGYVGEGYLTPLHVSGWTDRLMRYRWKEITRKKHPEQMFPWTILPPKFINLLSLTHKFDALPFAIGIKDEYPPFWDVDEVYIPLCVEERDWFLARIDMRTMKIYLYYTKSCGSSTCQHTSCIHHLVYPVIVQFESLFKSFLDKISYWEHSGRPYVEKMTVVGSEVWPKDNNTLGSQSGVLVCMLIRRLVLHESIEFEEEDVEEACMKYRQFMADEFYSARFLPTNI